MGRNRLREIRERAGLTQQQLAKKIGVTQQAIWYYEHGRREMRSGVLISLSEALECAVSDLLGLDANERVARQTPPSHLMPVVTRIAAGTSREDIVIDGSVHETPDSLWKAHPSGFWLKVSGNSMNRLFSEGTLVLIDPEEEVRNGDVGAVFVNDEDATLKRVYYDGDIVRLHPESYDPEYPDRIINRSEPSAPKTCVLGKAVAYASPDGWRA